MKLLIIQSARGEFIGIVEAAKLIASRDAQIRKEDAEIAVVFGRKAGMNYLQLESLRAAIVGKEGE